MTEDILTVLDNAVCKKLQENGAVMTRDLDKFGQIMHELKMGGQTITIMLDPGVLFMLDSTGPTESAKVRCSGGKDGHVVLTCETGKRILLKPGDFDLLLKEIGEARSVMEILREFATM